MGSNGTFHYENEPIKADIMKVKGETRRTAKDFDFN